jgi:hypothetical protein
MPERWRDRLGRTTTRTCHSCAADVRAATFASVGDDGDTCNVNWKLDRVDEPNLFDAR